MGGEQQNLVFIGTDGGSDQILGIDQTLVKFEECLVSGGSDPCDSLAVCRPQPGDVAREGVPQLRLGQTDLMTQLLLPNWNLPLYPQV